MTNTQQLDLNLLVSNPASPYYNMRSDGFGLPDLKQTQLDELEYERQEELKRIQRELDEAAEEQLLEEDVLDEMSDENDESTDELDLDTIARHNVYDNQARKLVDDGEVGPSEREEDKASDTGIWNWLTSNQGSLYRTAGGQTLETDQRFKKYRQFFKDTYTHMMSNWYDSRKLEKYGQIDLERINETDILNSIDYLDAISRSYGGQSVEMPTDDLNKLESSWKRTMENVLDVEVRKNKWDANTHTLIPRNEYEMLSDVREYAKGVAKDPEKYQEIFGKLSAALTQSVDKQNEALSEAAQIQKNKKDFLKDREPVSAEYLAKANAPTAFTDLDTYLYKLPGLVATSSGAFGWQTLSTVSGLASGIATTAGVLTGNPLLIAGGLGLAGVNLAGLVQAREHESLVEVHEKYKNNLKAKLDPDVYKKALDLAKKQSKDPTESEDEILDKLITGEYVTTDSRFYRVAQKELPALADVYTKNMALSAVDLAQTSIEAMPFGYVGKMFKFGTKFSKFAGQASDIGRTVARNTDRVLTFGLANDLSNIGVRRAVATAREAAGRVALSGTVEAVFDEGPLLIFGRDYEEGKYTGDLSYLLAFLDNIFSDGARAANGLFNPYSELHSDAEFIETVKSAYLLSAFMNGVPTVIQASYSLSQQQAADMELAELMMSQRFADRSSILMGVNFANAAKRHGINKLAEAFQFIENNNLAKSIPSDVMDAQKERLFRIATAAQSKEYQAIAKEKGIDPESSDYGIWVALGDFYGEKVREAGKSILDINGELRYPTATMNEDGVTFQLGDNTFSLPSALTRDADGNPIDPSIAIAGINRQLQLAILEDAIDNISAQTDESEKLKAYLAERGIDTPKSNAKELRGFLDSRKPKVKTHRSYRTIEASDSYKQAVKTMERKLLLLADKQHYLNKVDDFFGKANLWDSEGNPISELTWEELLKSATDEERAEMNKLTQAQKDQLLRKANAEALVNIDKLEFEAKARVKADIEQYKKSVKDDEALQTALEDEQILEDGQSEESLGQVEDNTENTINPETGEQVYTSPVDVVTEEVTEQLDSEELEDSEQDVADDTAEQTPEEQDVTEDVLEESENGSADAQQLEETDPSEAAQLYQAELSQHVTLEPGKRASYRKIAKEKERIDRVYQKAVAERDRLRSMGVPEEELPQLPEKSSEYKDEEFVTAPREVYKDSSPYGNAVNRITEKLEEIGLQLIPIVNPIMRQIYYNLEADSRAENDVAGEITYREMGDWKGKYTTYNRDYEFFFERDLEDLLEGYADEYNLSQETRKLIEAWLDLYDFKQSIIENDIFKTSGSFTKVRSEEELAAQMNDVMTSVNIASTELTQTLLRQEEAEIANQTIPNLSKEIYHMDGLFGTYEENKPYIDNSGKQDFLDSEMEFVLENDQVYLVVNYKGLQIKVKFAEGYGRGKLSSTNYTEHNQDLVAKVKLLLKQGKKVVPIGLTRTNMDNDFRDQNDPDRYLSLLNTPELGVTDVYAIDTTNLPIGIAHADGFRVNGNVVQTSKKAIPGTVGFVMRDGSGSNNVISLHTANISEKQGIAELLADVFLNINQEEYNGLPISSQNIVKFLLNFGPHTVPSLAKALSNPNLLRKQAYFTQEGALVIAGQPFNTQDVAENPEIKLQLVDAIRENLIWRISENYLGKKLSGIPLLKSIANYFKLNPTQDKVTLVPGTLEFTREQFEKGMTLLGWYVQNNVLTTDLRGFKNAKLHIKDVEVIENAPIDSGIQPEATNPVTDEVAADAAEADQSDALEFLFGDMSASFGLDKRINKDQLKDNFEQIEKEKEWLKETFGLTDLEVSVINGVVRLISEQMVSVGQTVKDGIILSRKAPTGTGFHEAFHRTTNLLLKPYQRKALYFAARARLGRFDLTDVQLDEILADEYASFMVDEGIKLDYRTKSLFGKMKLFLKLWAKHTHSFTMAKVIYNIGTGKYKGVEISNKNIERFKKLPPLDKKVGVRDFEAIDSNAQIDIITDGLLFGLLRDITDLTKVSELNLKGFKEQLELRAEKSGPVFKDILDNWDFFEGRLLQRLKKLGVVGKSLKLSQDVNDEIEQRDGDDANGITEHIASQYEFSHYNSAPKEVKFFFSRIPMVGYDVDGNARVLLDPSTNFPRIVNPAVAWNTALNDLHLCNSIDSIHQALTKLAENHIMYIPIKRQFEKYLLMSKSSNKEEALIADTFLTKLLTTIRSHKHTFLTGKIYVNEQGGYRIGIIDNGVDMLSKKYPSIWSANIVGVDPETSLFVLTDRGVELSVKGAQDLARSRNSYEKLVSALNGNGVLTANGKQFDLKLPLNLDRAKNQIVAILNSIGITIDKNTLEETLRHPSYGNENTSQYDRFKNFVVSDLNYGGLRSVFNIFGSGYKAGTNAHIDRIKIYDGKVVNMEIPTDANIDIKKLVYPLKAYETSGFVKFLAAQYVKALQNSRELRSIGAKGNIYYPISQNNFASDHVNELNERGAVFEQLKQVKFSQNSLILQLMESDPNLNITLETLVAFRTDDSRDQGRDYFEITDKEDYITKMALTMADRIVFPTIADKKTWHTIKGIKLFHDNLQFSATRRPDGQFQLDALFGNNVTDQFRLYALDELAAIEQCIEQLSEGGLDKTLYVKNYHTNNSYEDKNGNEHTVSPNGTRFRVFTGVYELQTTTENGKTTTKEVFINFNDPKESAEDNLATAKAHFFNRSAEEQRMMINKLLQKRVEAELQYLADLGMIRRPKNSRSPIGETTNVLLDAKVIDDMKKHYSSAVDGTGRPVQFVRKSAEGYAIYNAVAQHVVNTIVSVREVENLFSGDPAYYKIAYDENGIVDYSSDKIKRLSMLTSTGKNNRVDFEDWVDGMYTAAELKDYKVGSQQYDTLVELAYQGNLRRVVRNIHGDDALYNVLDGTRVSKTTQELEVEFASDNVVNEAKILTNQEFGGYRKGINVADAAVYISPTMYKKLMQAIGEFSPEIEEAFEILTNPDTSISAFDKMELYSKLLSASLKPLKYMAASMRFENGLGVPYFNKMALFPVFDFVATGDMQKMYERMTLEGNELDMILFDSAVKVGSRDAHQSHDDGQITDLSNLTVYKQSFKYIRQQLATDPHTHEEQLAGTQMLKVNLSNLEIDGVYGDVTGQWVKTQVIAAMNAISDKGVQQLREKFYKEDGTFDEKAFSKMLYEELADRGADINMLDGVSIIDGKMNVPLSALSNTNWLESILISMINKATVDIKLPGGAFIQRSTFGLDATRLDVISDRMLNNGRKLNLINDDGSMDSIVSINLFKHIIPGYKNKTFAQARQWLIDNGIIGDAASANAIGYRIPTQSQASISALRFVDVLPEIMGDTIVLPEEFTALTGSDFDVDKLYVSRYQYEIYEDTDGTVGKNGLLRSVKKARRIEFDDTKSHSENSMDANKNRLIEAYLKVLTDKARTNELKVSIDNDTKLLKDALAIIQSNKQVERPTVFSTYTPQYQEKIKAEYTTGKAGIGPMALNNAHHILTLLFNVRFAENDFTSALGIVNTNGIYGRDGKRILSWLSALINSFVDIAKDPYIIQMNVNPWTYNMTTFLIRMGFGDKTFFFLSQPILKEMAAAVSTTKGKYGVDSSKTQYELEQEAINLVLDKYDPTKKVRKHYEGPFANKAQLYGDLFSTDKLKETFTKPTDDVNMFDTEQVRIYYAFKALQPYARALADLVKYSKVDTKKTGKSLLQQQVFRAGMIELLTNKLFYPGDVTRFFNESFIEKKTANSVDFGRNLMTGRLLSCNPQTLAHINSILSRIGKKTTASEQLLNAIMNSIQAHVKSDFILHLMSENDVTYDSLLRGTNTMAHRLSHIIKDIRAGKYPDLIDANKNIDNALLNYIQPVTSNTEDQLALSFIRVADNTVTNDDQNRDDIINGWEYLLDHPNPVISTFARDLIYYAFITSGDNPGANSFFWAVPLSWRKNSGYADWMLLITGSTDWSINEDLIYLNNVMNNDLVPTYDKYEVEHEVVEIGGNSFGLDIKTPFIGLDSAHNYPGLNHPIHGIMFGIRGFADKYPTIRENDEGFPKFIKIRVGNKTITNPYAIYKLLGLMVSVVPNGKKTKLVNVPVYGLVSKRGYRSEGNTIVDYRSESNLFENEVYEFPQDLVDSPVGIETLRRIITSVYGEEFAEEFARTFTLEGQILPVMYNSDDTQEVAYEELNDNPTTANLPTGVTTQYGVTIDTNLKQNWRAWQNDNPNGIVAYRVNFNSYNTPEEAAAGRIGNPFSEDSRGADTVEKFFRWLVYGDTFGESKANEAYRSAIILKILNTPVGSPILYYKELGRPSHATIIGYLINNKHLLKQSTVLPTSDQTFEEVKLIHNETLEVLGGIGDEVAESEMSDAIAVAKKGISFEEALSEVTPVFTQEEIAQIKTALNGKPLQVKSVSRLTDPAFFAKEIIKFLEENAKKPFTDPTRVNAVEIWTKHDGTPIQDILDACAKYKVAPMVSFSITTLGDTALEKGVLKYTHLIPLIGKLIESGSLDPRTTTVRIDPILVGVTNMNEIRDVVNKCKALGIKKFVTSLVQSYGYTEGRFSKRIPNNRGGWSTEYRYDLVREEDSEGNVVIKDTNGNLISDWKSDDRLVIHGINEALSEEGKTYDWDKYYGRRYDGKIEFKPKQLYIDEVGNVLLDIAKDEEITLETCSFTIKGLKASACLDPMIIERVTGVDVTRPDGTYDRDTSRPECMCYGCHGDMFRFNEKKCFSSCGYCYAAHSGDSVFEYYNEDGTLKDRPLTKVRDYNSYFGDLFTLNEDVVESMEIALRGLEYLRTEVFPDMELSAEEQAEYEREFSTLLNEDKVDTQDKLDNALLKFICNL